MRLPPTSRQQIQSSNERLNVTSVHEHVDTLLTKSRIAMNRLDKEGKVGARHGCEAHDNVSTQLHSLEGET
jgi:hypothetical protein